MHKIKLTNKYIILSFVLLFCVSFLSWGIISGYIRLFFTFKGSPEFTREFLFANMFDFTFYINDGFTFLQILLPLIVSFSVMNFVDERNGLFPYVYPRIKNYRKFLLSTMCEYAAISSIALSISYILYCIVGILITNTSFDNMRESSPSTLFADIFGSNFYLEHVVLYHILDGILKYVIFPFIYSFFTMAITFYTNKKYIIVSIPTAYCVVLTFVFNSLYMALENVPVLNKIDFRVLAGNHPITADTRIDPSTALIGVSYIPVIIFVVVTIMRSFKEGEKVGT